MALLPAFLFLLCLLTCAQTERVRLEAKKLMKGKVLANGLSISAKSLARCVELCNRRKRTCDGVVYHELIEKCRLIKKCAPAYQVDNSSEVVYYSRRPQIMNENYIYDPKSESCFGLVSSDVNYAEADRICRKQNAHLVIVSGQKMNEMASNLLKRFGVKWAWINDENRVHKNEIQPSGISGNDVISKEVFSPVVVSWRNKSLRSCWGVNNLGQWAQFSCKNATMMPLCQVPQFKL